MASLTRETLARLPKAQLHLHLEAAMRPATAHELADRYGRPAPKSGPYDGLAGFVADYESARDLIGSLDDLARVAGELVEDAAAQGIVWTEVHCVPFNYTGRLGPEPDIVEAVLDGLRRGAAESGSEAALILAHNRAASPALAGRTLALAEPRLGDGVVAFGLVGNERDFSPSPYADVFARAKSFGLLSVPHAGEAAGPASVRSAWRDLGADRIGHGVRAVEDPQLVRQLADAGVSLDVCPTSNAMLQACPSLAEHQLPQLIKAGVRVSLGSDGPLFFGVDLVDEYVTAHTVLGLNAGVLARIAADSLHASAAPRELVQYSEPAIASWLAAFSGPLSRATAER
jgi:adenosine deaminase